MSDSCPPALSAEATISQITYANWNQRGQNQHDRIANGMKDGQLTPGQAAHLEKGEQRLQNNEKKDIAADKGQLTKQDQKQLNKEADRQSNKIYKDKHSN